MAKPAAKSKTQVAVRPEPVEWQTNALRITCAREGFRRAGRAWSITPTEVMLAEFDDAQLAMLRAEPMLTIEDIVIEAAE